MTDVPVWATLFWQFFLLCCLSVGGTNTVLPDMHRFVVEEHGWITDRQFADLFALAQAAPGPNALWVTLIGLQIDGWSGALATTLALLIPSTALSFVAVALQTRHPHSVFGTALRRGRFRVAYGFPEEEKLPDLYHNDTSACAQKLRVTLEEKKLAWNSIRLDLRRGSRRAASVLIEIARETT